MTAIELAAVLGVFSGAVLLLSDLRWFRDRPLVERLRPYGPGPGPRSGDPSGSLPAFRAVVGPLAQTVGGRVSALLGVTNDLPLRLARAGRSEDAETFRLRQLAHAILALLGAAVLTVAMRPDPPLAIMTILGAPLLAVLVHEHRVSRDAARRRDRLAAELPVLVEQLGLLISAGRSTTAALTRLAARTGGVAAEDLHRVLLRVRHGLSEHEALAEWADECGLDAVRRLTSVLALHGQTADLGLLISDEARSVRAEAHRDLLETIERRAQLVWIPVTVATLVPGLIFLAVPFTSAMSQVTGGS